MGRIILGIIVVLSILWIGFVGYDILLTGNDYDPNYLFSDQMIKILVINRPSETQINSIPEFNDAPLKDLIAQLPDSIYDFLYCSFSQPKTLISNPRGWTKENIQSVIKLNGQSATSITENTFKIGNFVGRYRKDLLFIGPNNFSTPTTSISGIYFDKKASCAILTVRNQKLGEIKDVYFKSSGQTQFITRNLEIQEGKQVNDEALFSKFLPSGLNDYHFTERDFLMTSDPVFASGPMTGWLQNGFVQFNFLGSPVIVSDYIDGQDPLLLLQEVEQTEDTAQFSTPLKSDFPEKYFVKHLDEMVVISPSKSACDQVLAEFKLGNTIALNSKKRDEIYRNLPKMVSERLMRQGQHLTRSAYHGYLLETHLTSGSPSDVLPVETQKSIALACNTEIIDFEIFSGWGNAVALGKNAEIICFKNGKEVWKKALNDEVIGGLQRIDLHGNGSDYFLITARNKIYLFDENGSSPTGFPIQSDEDFTQIIKFYRWKEKSYFLAPLDNNKVAHFDAKGRELNLFKSLVSITDQVDVWASQGKLFAGFKGDQNFEMFSLDQNKSYRVFDVNKGESVKVPNELILFHLKGNQLIKTDQKGTSTSLNSYPSAQHLSKQDAGKNPLLFIQSGNSLHLLNQEGISFSKISIPFNDLESVYYFTDNSGKSTVAMINGLENNVYLYSLNGKQIGNESLEGSKKVLLAESDKQLIVTTIVDQFIVQYIVN